MADNTNKQKLYDVIVSEGLYTKSYDDFNSQYSNPEAKTKLYNVLKDRGLYSKSPADFENKYFSASPIVEKKNPIQNPKPVIKPATVSPSASKTTKPSLGLGQQVITGPSASFLAAPTKAPAQPKAVTAPQQNVSVTPTMQSQGQLLMAQPKPKTANEFLAAEKKRRDVVSPTFAAEQALKPQQPKPKVGALEDIGNTFMSSLSSMAAGISGLPNMAEKTALMMTTKMLGIDDEYNALPVAAKKEINNIMSSVASRSIPSPNISAQAQEFFIKKSNEFSENTNKSDKYLNERIGDFYKNPSVDKASDLFLEIPKLFAGSLPYMINPALGALSSASQTYSEDLKQSQGKLGWGQLLNAGVTGVTEYYIERLTNGILNRSVADAVGVKRAAGDFAKGFIKSVLKDVGLEAGGEAVTELTQSLSDDITKGVEIDWVKTANKALDAGIGGFGMAAGMRATGAGLGYLAKKVMPKSDKDIVDRNTRAIMDLNTKKGPDNSPEVNAVIDSKIGELNMVNIDIINNSINTVKSLSDDQIKEIVNIDNGIEEVYKKRDAIVEDPNLNDEEKQSLLDYLKTQAVTLNQQKDAIQKQTTSQVPVQPEAGTGLQVAEGESKAEPQVPTQEGQGQEVAPVEEVKIEEVVPLKKEDISFGTAFDIQNETAEETIGREKDKWGESQVIRERVENAGDILRELSSRGNRPDPGYLLEKVNKLKRWIEQNKKYPAESIPSEIKTVDDFNKTDLRFTNTVDSYEYLNKFNYDILQKVKGEYEAIPTYTKEQAVALDLVLDLINNNIDGLESKLKDIENIANKIKQDGKLEIVADVRLSKAQEKAQVSETQQPITEQPTTEQPVPEEPTAPFAEEEKKTPLINIPGYERMMGEVDGIVEKSFNRGVPYMQTMDNAIKYMEKSKVYENATDSQREAMVREVRKMFKQKEKKAPTAQKILGQEPTKTTITIDESKELNKRLKALEAAEQTGRKIGYKEGLKESEQARKDILDYVKSLKVNNKITGSQFKAIVNALKANLLNPAIRKRVEERIDKIIKKANYADQLDRSNKLRAAIKKASKSKTLAANIAIMAKKFAKVNPNNVDNLDEYIDMANLVYGSIGKPMRTIAEEAMVNEYSEIKIKEAQEAKTIGLEELFNSLVEQGLIPKNLSLAEIQQYILDEEQNKKVEESEKREKEKRDVLNTVFDALKDISNVMLNDGYNPFTGEEVDLTAEDRQLLKDFTAMDLDNLPIASAYRAQEALMNYIVNGKKFGMRGILARYQGDENAKIAVKKGLKAADFRWAVGGSWWGSRKWAKEVESIPGLFTWLFRGRSRGREVMKLMGLDEFMAGAAEAKIDRVSAENEYIAKFLDKKPNGKRFNNINNTYERLVYAYLSRSVDGSAEEKQAEYDRRKRILAQNVQAMEQSRNKDLIEEAQVLKRELNKAKDAKNTDELKDKFDPINIQAVEFISGKFDEYFDKVDEVAEGIYNLILNKDDLYTPDMFRDISEKEVNVAEMRESVDIPFDLLNKQPVGTMLENKRIPNLPGYDVKNKDASKVSKILKLDFDSSAFNALEKSLTDTYTAEAVQKYSAFVKSDEFSKLFDNVNDEKLFKEIVNYYINNERGKIGYKSDWKAVQNFSSRLKNLSTYRALGSATAFLKQSASAIVNTAANLSNDPYALSQVTKAMLKDEAIGDFINRSKSEINLRGAEATADIKSAEKLIRESKYQGLTDALDALDKAGRLQMKSLSLGDVPMARASWFGYYVHALKIQGKPYKNIDWSKAKLDKDAAFYANTEISLNQNASMPSTLGQLFSSKNPLTRLTATYLFPFTSFLFNAKSRMKTDITVLTSKLATAEDKQAAGRSLVATLAELPTYIAISTAINYALVGAANSFLGYDEDEEDEKLRLKRYAELALTRIITDLISPLPNIGDVATVAAFNAILEKAQEDPEMEEEDKKDIIKLFESKPDNMIQAMAELLLQPLASTGRRVADIYTTIDMATGDTYTTDKGKEIEFTDEDKRMLQIVAAMQIMGSLNLLPSEGESLAKKIVKAVEKRNKEEGNY